MRHLRQLRDLKQSDVAEAAGLPQRNISEYERGVRVPDVTSVIKLANALDVTLAELIASLGFELPLRDRQQEE